MKDTLFLNQFNLPPGDTLLTTSGTRTTDWKPLPSLMTGLLHCVTAVKLFRLYVNFSTLIMLYRQSAVVLSLYM